MYAFVVLLLTNIYVIRLPYNMMRLLRSSPNCDRKTYFTQIVSEKTIVAYHIVMYLYNA